MNETPAAAGLTEAAWFKSSYSAADNECVEVARALSHVGIRDSKSPYKEALIVSASSFAGFVAGIGATSPRDRVLMPYHNSDQL